MSRAVTCPVCNGTGKVRNPDYNPKLGQEVVTCHGCGGRGWVEVGNTSKRKIRNE